MQRLVENTVLEGDVSAEVARHLHMQASLGMEGVHPHERVGQLQHRLVLRELRRIVQDLR